MSRKAVTALLRAAGPRVGLHSEVITPLPSLAACLGAPLGQNRAPNFSAPGGTRGCAAAAPWRQLHTTAAAAAAAAAGGDPQGGSLAEQYDLLPPDTGTVRIEGYDDTGFIVADVQVEGSVLAAGDLWLSWAPNRLADVTPASLRLLDLLRPRPELVVLGCGAAIGPVPPALAAALRERDIAIEALDTVNAVATFNILNQEGRAVLGALLPAGSDPSTPVDSP